MFNTIDSKVNEINQNNFGSNDKLVLINLANETWGEHEWNYRVTNEKIDFIDNVSGEYSVSVIAFVRITLKSGISHEDLGCATIKNNNKGFAISQARQSAVINALREVLYTFGGKLASKLSEKEYTRKPDSVKPEEVTSETIYINKRKSNEIDNNSDIPSISKNAAKTATFYTSTPIVNNEKSTRNQNVPVKEISNPKSFIGNNATINPQPLVVNSVPKIVSSNPISSCSITAQRQMTEEELRVERLKRQKLMQEQYRKQMQ